MGPRRNRVRTSLVHGHLGKDYSLDGGRLDRSDFQSKFHQNS